MKSHLFLSLCIYSFSYGSAPFLSSNQLRVLPDRSKIVVSYLFKHAEEGLVHLEATNFPGNKKNDSFYADLESKIRKVNPNAECLDLISGYIKGTVRMQINNGSNAAVSRQDYMLTFKE